MGGAHTKARRHEGGLENGEFRIVNGELKFAACGRVGLVCRRMRQMLSLWPQEAQKAQDAKLCADKKTCAFCDGMKSFSNWCWAS